MFQMNQITSRLLVVTSLLAMLSVPFASVAEDKKTSENKTAYVDSVYDWGLWEFGPSPAAGGTVQQPRALTAKTTNVQFRPNDNSTFSSGVAAVSSLTTPTPVPPPPISTATPLSPGTTPPTGGPGDRF